MKKIVFPILVAVLFQCTPMLAQVASVEIFPQGTTNLSLSVARTDRLFSCR